MHPNSIANLRPPWRPGERPPSPGPSKVERALKITQDASPKAARLIAQTVSDPEAPLGLRVRCAEYLLDKALPTPTGGQALQLSGVEFLELRFVAPGQQQALPLLQGGNSTIEHEQDQALSGDTEAEYGNSTEEAEPG